MNDDKDKQDKQAQIVVEEDSYYDEDEERDREERSGESLLSLVQPEMITLSKHWLDALKDHALLSLPPGMCSNRCHSVTPTGYV